MISELQKIEDSLNTGEMLKEVTAMQLQRQITSYLLKLDATNDWETVVKCEELKIQMEINQDNVPRSESSGFVRVSRIKFLEASHGFLSVYEKVNKNEILYKALVLMVICPIMDLNKSKTYRLLSKIDLGFLDSVPLGAVLTKITNLELVTYLMLEELEQFLQKEIYSSGSTSLSFLKHYDRKLLRLDLFQSIMEYNMFVVSSMYSVITYDSLTRSMLQCPNPTKLLLCISNIITSGRFAAKMDDYDRVIYFSEKEPQEEKAVIWKQKHTKEFLTLVNGK